MIVALTVIWKYSKPESNKTMDKCIKGARQQSLKTVQIREVVFEIKYMENAFLHVKASES
jgi:hypothetical protein